MIVRKMIPKLMILEYITDNPSAPIKYICQECNQGKGAAIHTAITYVDGRLYPDPGMPIWNMIQRNIIFTGANPYGPCGYRVWVPVHGRAAAPDPFFWHTLGNKLLTFISNLFTNMNLTDAHTCYKLIRTDTLRRIPLREKRFSFDAELNVKISRIRGVRIYEVGISYYGRTFAEGKKIRLRDAVRSMFCLMKYSVVDRNAVCTGAGGNDSGCLSCLALNCLAEE